MHRWKSATGGALAALYMLAFAVAYVMYQRNAGQLFADAPVMFVALPYTLTILAVFGSVDLSADNLRTLVRAALFCAVVAYFVGAAIEAVVRAAFGFAQASWRLSHVARSFRLAFGRRTSRGE